MKKATLNYWVDMMTGAALLVCAATGIVRMFPEATSISSGSATILGVSPALWATVHDWSGVVMASGVALHTVLHLRWLVHMTRKTFGRDARTRSHERTPAAAGARAAVRPGPAHGMAGRAASPQAAAAAALSRLDAMGRGAQAEEPRRLSRKAFLTSAAALGGVAVLAGAGLLARSEIQAVAVASTSAAGTTSTGTSSVASTASGTTSTSDSGATAGTQDASSGSSATTANAGATARVAVDSGACVGCGHCLQTCPQGVFTLDGGKATAADGGSCTLCGRCVQVCQPQAITLNG